MTGTTGEQQTGGQSDGSARLGPWRMGLVIAAPFIGVVLLFALPGLTGVLAAVLALAVCPLVLLTAVRGRLLRSVVVALVVGYAVVVLGILALEVSS